MGSSDLQAALQHDWFKMHLGWEADAPRLVQTVLPQLVSSWAAHPGAVAPQPAAQLQQQPVTVVLSPVATGVPVVSPVPVRTAKPVVANNVLPVGHKSGGASARDDVRAGASRAGAKPASKRVARKAGAGRRSQDGSPVATRARATNEQLQTACGVA